MQCNVFIKKNIMHFIIWSKTESKLKLSVLHSCGMKDSTDDQRPDDESYEALNVW